jgi:hypothetical protein
VDRLATGDKVIFVRPCTFPSWFFIRTKQGVHGENDFSARGWIRHGRGGLERPGGLANDHRLPDAVSIKVRVQGRAVALEFRFENDGARRALVRYRARGHTSRRPAAWARNLPGQVSLCLRALFAYHVEGCTRVVCENKVGV